MIDVLLDGLAHVLSFIIGVTFTRILPAAASVAADQLLGAVCPIVALALLMIGLYYIGMRLRWWS